MSLLERSGKAGLNAKRNFALGNIRLGDRYLVLKYRLLRAFLVTPA